jgi:RNA polymerase sigma-B factor
VNCSGTLEPPTKAGVGSDVRVLFRTYRETGDARAREQLVLRHLPLVRALARRFRRRDEQLEDLIQVGAIGLMKAIDRFDTGRDVAFTTYAVPTIVGEIAHHLRDHGSCLKAPSRVQELRSTIARVTDELTTALRRSPRISEIAEAADVSAEAVVEALAPGPATELVPVSELEAHSDMPVEDQTASYREFEQGERRVELARGLQGLDERERRVVYRRFFEDLTQSEIAAELRISQVHVSRLLSGAIEKMRRELDDR